MDLKDEDFAGLKYNCFPVLPRVNLLDHFTELKRYPEFLDTSHGLDHNQVIRYVLYLYDKKTPLISEKNLGKRKMLAAKLAGFEMVDKRYPEIYEKAILGRNEIVNRMICCFVRNQKDIQYATLMTGLSMFYDNLAQLSKPSEREADMEELNRKSTLFNHTIKMISTLEETANDTFNGDAQLMYEADEIEQVETGKIRSYPEHIATLRESGELGKLFKKMEKDKVV